MKVIDVSHPLGKRPSPDTNWFINVLYVLSVLHMQIGLHFLSGSNVSKTMTISFHVKVGCRNIYSRMFQSKNSKNPNRSSDDLFSCTTTASQAESFESLFSLRKGAGATRSIPGSRRPNNPFIFLQEKQLENVSSC